MTKSFIRPSIEQAITTLGLSVTVESEPQAGELRTELARRFGDGTVKTIHWNHLRDYAAVQHPDSWEWIAEYPALGQAQLLFAHESDEPTVFRFGNTQEIRNVLEECPGFEFYVCDERLSYLLCHNDHDYLLGTGDAESWVESLLPRHEQWVASLPDRSH